MTYDDVITSLVDLSDLIQQESEWMESKTGFWIRNKVQEQLWEIIENLREEAEKTDGESRFFYG